MGRNFDFDANYHSEIQATNLSEDEMIAVVGMSCLLPGGISHYEDFWSLLVSGTDQHSVVPFSRWNASVYFNSESTNDEKTTTENSSKSMIGMTNTNHGYFLPNNYLTDIDPSLFYLSPAEVPAIDPQQRLLLKLSLSCFDDAGIIASKIKGSKTGVFIGVMNLDYGNNQSNRYLNVNEFTSLGLSNSISSNRISYTFDLRGPSITLDTACSSSAVCIHHAMNSLRNYQTDMCLVGGINVLLSPRVFVTLSQMNLLSPDGRCKAFDEKGDGYARGEGGGMLLLKRLSDAIRDNDRIHGLLVSSCINQDGRSSIPITSPNIQSQIDLYTTAYQNCKLNPTEVQYIEAHGTGTAKGDAVEISSIQSFFLNEQHNSSQLLRIGSVKTNIGHLESGAGVIGVMKSLLCLKHGKFVPSLHFNNYPSSLVNVHPHLKVQTTVEDWLPIAAKPRFCGVNSFGYGGTNVHTIVMEYVNKKQQHYFVNDNHNRILPYILPISIKNKHALSALMQDHALCLTDVKNPQDLDDYCYTLACRKLQFNHRAAIIGTDHQSLIEHLKSESTNNIYTHQKFLFSENTKLTFLFGGQGSQCIGMGLNLMCFPVFAEHMFKINEWTIKNHNWSLLHSLKENSLQIEEPNVWTVTQATIAIFAVETSTAVLLAHYGVYPSTLIGHSAGEFAALYCSCLLDLDTLLSILWTLCTFSMDDSVPKAQIVEIRTSSDEFQLLLNRLRIQYGVLNVEIACINSSQSITVAGYYDHMEIIKQHISVNLFSPYSIPFHTSLMEIIKIKAIAKLEEILTQRKNTSISDQFFPITTNNGIVQLIDTNGFAYSINNPESIRMKSDLPFFTSQYWWNVIGSQVNFPNQINTALNMVLRENGASLIMLDLSPQPVLATESLLCMETITKHQDAQDFPYTVLSVHSTYEANASIKFATILAELYVNGYSNEKTWYTLYPMGKISDLRLPSIPYQNSSYWSESLESLRSRMLASYDKQLPSLLTKFHPILETNVTHRDFFCVCLYEAYIQIPNWPVVQHHVFENSMLLPAAYYFEIFFAVGDSLLPNINYRIKNIQLKEAFWMDESDDYYIKLEVKPKGLLSFEINVFGCSIPKESNSFSIKQTHSLTLYSTAILEYDSVIQSVGKRQLNNDFIRLSQECNSTQFYQIFRERGFNYGESFSLVQHTYSQPNKGKALVQIKLPSFIKHEIEENNYHLHPGVIDASIQGTANVIDSLIHSASLPIGCEIIEIYKSLSTITDDYLWAEVFSRPSSQEGVESADLYLFSNTNEHIASFINFTSKHLSHKQNTSDHYKIAASMAETSDYIYIEFIESHNTEIEENNNIFLAIISNDELKDKCKNNVDLPIIQCNSQTSVHSLSSDLESFKRPLDIVAIVPEIIEESIIQYPELIYKNLLLISDWLLIVFQAIIELQSTTNNSKIVSSFQIVSRCSSPKIQSSLIYGCIPGYYRVWLHEKPATKCRLIELDIEPTMNISQVFESHVLNELYMLDVTTACHVKLNPSENKRFVAYYNFTSIEPIEISVKLFSSKKTYVLFGGCTSMGMYVANWMAQLGTKYIILASRSGFSNKLKEKEIFDLLQKNLANQGVEIKVSLLDITSPTDVQHFFESYSNIGGVINMCMELNDSVIETQTTELIKSGCAPKVLGSLLIHTILDKLNYILDFFILFSSTTSMFGNEGQFTYAGANAFMDSFALYAQSKTPYFAISLPAIADVGYLSNNQRVREFVEKNGWETVPMKQICEVLASIIYQLQFNQSNIQKNIGILRVNPIKFTQSNSFIEHLNIWKNILKKWHKTLPQFLTIIHQDQQQNEQNKNSPQAISNTVTKLIATHSGFSEYDQLPPNETRLSDLGFHSLAAMDLKANISKLFQIDLPISLLLGPNTTIKQIQRKVIDSIKENPENNDPIQISSENEDSQSESLKIPFTDDNLSLQLRLEIPIIIPFRSTSLELLHKKLNDIIIYLKTVDTVTFSFTLLHDIYKWIENAEKEKNQSYQILVTISSLEKTSVIDQFSNTLPTIISQSLSENKVDHQPIVIFLFPGQGEQYSNMSAGLYKYNETYRKCVDSLCELISSNHWLPKPKEIEYEEFNLRHLLFPSTAPQQLDPSTTDSILLQTEYAQPATFIISYALTQYLIKLGVKPSYCFGHSLGEYLAACISGVLTVVDALDIICHRALFMSQCLPGKMLAIKHNLVETKNLLTQFDSTKMNLEISVCNSEQQTVVGGSFDNINSFKNWLKEKSIIHKELVTSHAYHTSSMRPAADKLINYLSKLFTIFHTPTMPYMSNLTGELITHEQATDLHYYGEHMCKTVQAWKNIDNLIHLIKSQQSAALLIEIGPGQTLTNLVKQRLRQQNMDSSKTITILNTLKPKRSIENSNLFEDINIFLTFMTNLYKNGLSIFLSQIYSDMYSSILKSNLEMRLSYAQERLWFMEQVMPNHAAFRTTSTFHVSIGKQEIRGYIEKLIDRHPIMRTSIHYDENGYLYHKLHDVVEWTIEEDLSLLNLQRENYQIYSTEWYNQMNLILKSHSTKSFILEQAPLFRFVYLPITESQDEAILHAICHHLLMDAYSASLVSKEIYLLLNNEIQQHTSEYITPTITFFQHALYERLIIDNSYYQQRLSYWKTQLKTTDYYSIPLDENVTRTDASHYYSIQIDNNLLSNIRQISADVGITISSFLASVIAIVLSRYNDGRSSHIAFGMTEARYLLPDAKSLVGCFVNLLVIRSEIQNDLSIKNIMLLIHNLILEAMDNSYPFIEMISKLKLKRNANFNSLFQVLYNFRQLTYSSNGNGFQTIGYDQYSTPQFDFEFHVNCYDSKELQIYMLASAQANHLASFIADSYTYILQQICHENNLMRLLISDLSLVSNVGNEMLMLMMNSSKNNADYSNESQYHFGEDLVSEFNKSVEQYPNNIAIVDTESKIKLTYQQLSDYSTYFAQEILQTIKSFSEPQKYIGIYLERHAFVPLTIWAVLKSGVAYIPLDPQYFPAERLTKVIKMTSIHIIITSYSLLTQLKQIINDKDIEVLLCDSIFSLNHSIKQFKNPLINRDSTAYVEFTSGSTGIPKGVPITHGNLLNQFQSCLEMYKFNNESICLEFHSFAFDLHAWEVFGTLFSGGCLIILHNARDMDGMFRLCKQTNVTHISMTPSTFKYFISNHHNEILPMLKCIMLCGEKFDYSLLRDWYKIYSDADVLLVNAFGITETTVINSFRKITINDLNQNTTSLSKSWIGHPMRNNYFAVLNEKQQLVPPLIAGELYIGGDCVSVEGYMNSPLSNVNFVQLTLPKYEHVTRWYRTGDFVVYDSIVDDFAYLGRITQQIKLGGVRIEPQEIENILNQIQGISHSVVVPVAFNDSLQLVAYLKKSKQISIDNNDDDIYSIPRIRARLQQSLPQIMIPSKFIFLSSFPLTNSEKTDRTLLSKLETVQKYRKKMLVEKIIPEKQTNKSHLPFQSETDIYFRHQEHNMNKDDMDRVLLPSTIVVNSSVERKSVLIFKDHIHHQIMNIFNYVLGHNISPTSRFFEDEGTTSLQAVQLVHLINSTFNCQLGINILHLNSTVIQLADYLKSESHAQQTPLVHLVLNQSISTHRDNQLSLIFIHPAGGGSVQYINVAQKISQIFPDIYIYCLERIHKYEGIDLINLYSETLKANFTNKKIALIGYSQGGNIAYELAKRMSTELEICFIKLIDSKLNDNNTSYTDAEILSSLIYVIDKTSNINNKHIEQYLSQNQSIELKTNLCKIVASKLDIEPFNNETVLSNFIQSFRQDISLCEVLSPDQFPQTIPVIFVAANEVNRQLAEEWKNFVNINLYISESDHRSILYDPLLIHYLSNTIKQYGYPQNDQDNSKQKETSTSNHIEEVSYLTKIEEKRINDIKMEFEKLLIYANHQISRVKSNISQLISTCAAVLDNSFSSTKVTDNAFSVLDNMNTGNSCAEPMQEFTSAVQLASREIDKYRHYQPSPHIDKKLQNLILDFCKTVKWLGIDTDQQSVENDLGVAIGSGTTQLWDCILRTIIVRKNDVVLVPSPSYGLFLPQIEMLSSQIVLIPVTQENNFKLSSIELHSAIVDTHSKLIRKWLKELPFNLKNLLRTLYDNHLLVESNSSIQEMIDKQIDEFVQRIQQIIPVKSKEELCLWKYVEDELSEFMCNYLFNGDTRLLVDIQNNGLKSTLCPDPPRIVALLHINPTIFGTLYTKKDLRELAKICEQQKICVIEDLAYALLQLPINNQFNTSIATFHSIKSEYKTMKSILLFGLSKPFAVADMRIGFAIGKRAVIDEINIILTVTSCFTPILLQSSISVLFSLEHSKLTDYLAMNAHLYKTKRNLLLACLMGFDKIQYERTIEQSEIDETKLILEQIIQEKKYNETTVKFFRSIGLSKYFTICCIPAAGFFVIVNCQPFLQSIGRQYNLKTSFDVALFLSYFYRIRVVPEEMMGIDLQQTTSSQLLRLSYTISNENIVEATFTIFSTLFKLNTSIA
ncbi:unnamed protein product [Rotaria sordida]|uniref:oleoyl-[acyl-carrier-protein] hydrolase n=1 Tax=Rotaria sordida TaxID=392033 RepID=A0A819AAH9_9BILA|nr:unnamed protein product [Rotaria sordida]